MYEYPRGTCYVNLTPNPWYNLAASIVIDAVLAADISFFEKGYGDALLELMAIRYSGTDLINAAERSGRLYAQQAKSCKRNNSAAG